MMHTVDDEEATEQRPVNTRDGGVAGWARRQQRAKEEALGPLGRIELALTLGLRAKALRKLAGR